MTPIPPPIKRSAMKRAARILGPAAKYATPVLAGAALLQGGPSEAAETLLDVAVGDIMSVNTADSSFAAGQKMLRDAKFRKEVEPQMGLSKNIQRETARKRQERLRRERRAQETNPLAEAGTRAMEWLQERFR